jgi:nicotinamide-nucleotide amidase
MDGFSEAVIVGSELLLGMGIDTNGAEIGRRMSELGCPLRFKTVAGDSDADLDLALSRALERSRVVLLSGGLGPTEDDRTRFAVARAAGVGLELREELVEDIRATFRRFNREMSDSNLVQARMPEGAEAIRNPLGTAPGFALEIRGCYVIALPGVPRELRFLLENEALPRLRSRLGIGAIATRTLRFSGIGESLAGEAVADLMSPERNPYVGILASPGEVRVFVTARAPDEAAARELLRGPEAEIRGRLAKHFFGVDAETHPRVALRAAAGAGWFVSSAEGFTAGHVCSELWESGEPNYLGGQVYTLETLRRLLAGSGPGERVLELARLSAATLGASAGLAVALEQELVAEPAPAQAWIGIWTRGPTLARPFPLFYGDAADRQRVAHQAFYHLRTFARTAAG